MNVRSGDGRESGDGGFETARALMVEHQLRARGIGDERVLDAMGRIPREAFVPPDLRDLAYADGPQPIGFGQTISQPYIVALMTEALELNADDRVLEIGTGCGYQTAILCRLAREVWTVEFVPELAGAAETRLRGMGFANARVRCGDGRLGWPEAAPFDAIIATCAPPAIPSALVDQLAENGRLVIPVGREGLQELRLVRKSGGRLEEAFLAHVRFVPMVG